MNRGRIVIWHGENRTLFYIAVPDSTDDFEIVGALAAGVRDSR